VRWARWWILWFLLQIHEGTTTVTSDQIVYHQRVRMLDHARASGNVAETCRTFGISPKTFYKWRNAAAKYGLSALMPKTKRPPAMPNATPTHIIEMLMTLAITAPTLGCRQYADRLGDQGFEIGKSTVQNVLIRHGLGRRHQRLARAAAITALTTGLVTEIAVEDEPFGFCHWSGRPAGLVAVDSFYIGNLKGVGKVYQLSAVDTATRWAMVWLVHGTVNKDLSAAFFKRIYKTWAKMGFPIEAVVADNEPEYKAAKFADAPAAQNVARIKSRPDRQSTTPWSNDSKARCCRSAGDRRFTGSASTARVNSNEKQTPGSTPTTTNAETTPTTWPTDDPSTSSN